MIDNPYGRWRLKKATHFTGRRRQRLVTDIKDELLQGGSVALYGGHGMGKSALLTELEEQFNGQQDVCVAYFRSAPRSIDHTLQKLAQKLAVSSELDYLDPLIILEQWVTAHPNKQLILLYDELDTYISLPNVVTFFSALENALQELEDIGLVGAGGLGLLFLGARELGSTFMSRATTDVLEASQTLSVSVR
ncbi:MAG: AAA family ATPase, partial [Myxococcota bacterium]